MKTTNQQGVTLVEIMVALALSVITVSATYTIYANQVQRQIMRDEQLDMQQHARVAMDLLIRELHMAGYDPRHVNQDQLLTNDFNGITSDPSTLVINADLNGNGAPTDSNEFIQISHDPHTMTLRRNTGGGRQSLAEHIQDFSVKYFNGQGQETKDSQEIRQVEVTITARTTHPDPKYPLNAGYRTLTLRSRVTPQNLGL